MSGHRSRGHCCRVCEDLPELDDGDLAMDGAVPDRHVYLPGLLTLLIVSLSLLTRL